MTLTKAYWWSAAVHSLVLLLITAPLFFASLKASKGLPPAMSATPIWLESAECDRTTGAFLSLCINGGLLPIADKAAGYDPGHPLFLGVFSWVTGTVVVPEHISILNTVINYAGIVILSALFYSMRLRITSLLLLTLGAVASNEYHALSYHPSQYGTACLAAALPISILWNPSNYRIRTAWIATGLACLAMTTLLRQSIGMMGTVSALLATAVNFKQRKWLTSVALVVTIFLSSQTPYLVLAARDATFHVPKSERMEQHGIWHNLYIGLGVVPNPFGIEWNDNNGAQTVKRLAPQVQYGSNKYYDVLRTEYFRILFESPRDVAIVYVKKLVATFDALKGLFVLFFMCIPFLAALRWLIHERGIPSNEPDTLMVIGLLFFFFFVGQSVIFNFAKPFAFPINVFLLLVIGSIFEMLYRLIERAGLQSPMQ